MRTTHERPEAGPGDDPTTTGGGMTVDQVVELLSDIYATHPEGVARGTPAADRIREIGLAVHRAGGMRLMLAIHRRFAAKHFRHARNLEMRWNGIGEWLG